MNETRLFFKCLFEKTFIFKGQSCSGGKHRKKENKTFVKSEHVEHRKIKTTFDWKVETTMMF